MAPKTHPATGRLTVIAVMLAILALLVSIVSVFFYMNLWNTQTTSRSYPAVPKAISKNTNTTINTNSSATSVQLTEPFSGATVTSPIGIAGSAPGNWFFEAVFPIILEDADGNELARAQAQAVGDWMTTGPVEFTSSLEYTATQATSAVLVFRPDNPSGKPSTEEYRLPITLSPNP